MGSTESRRARCFDRGLNVWQFPRRRFRTALPCAPRRSLTLAVVAVAAGPMVLVQDAAMTGGTPTLTWYVNPDNGGQRRLAEKCGDAADGAYRIETQVLPTGRRAARAARPPARGRGSVDRPDEPRPALRRRVRQRRLPAADHARGRRRLLHRRRARGAARDRGLGRAARRAAALGEHPAALVPQVGRRGGGRRSRQPPTSRGTR